MKLFIMNNQEALELLMTFIDPCKGCEFNHELECELNKECYIAFEMSLSALKNKIPKKPKYIKIG